MKMLLVPVGALLLGAATLPQDADLGTARALLRAGNVAAALPKLEGAAARGNGEAANLLGDLYYEGSGAISQDRAKSLLWYRKGSEAGNAEAMFSLGWQYQYGEGTAKDSAQAFHWYERAANAGHVKSMYRVGDAYASGEGAAKDQAKAIVWLRKAAEAGHTLAMVDYGFALDKGNGVAEDKAAAFALYRKAGEAGSGTGAFNTGVFYRDGITVPVNRAAAIYWFLRSAMARSPHPNAEEEIASLRAGGDLTSAEGKALHEQAEKLAHAARTDKELQASKPKSFALHLQAAQLGHLPSINMMMTAYREKGWGTEPDLAKSREWAQISADMDDREGQRVLAAFMLNGIGGPRNTQGARFWYEKAALQGNAQAMMALAKIYDGEYGLPPNEALAIYWYKEAYKKKWFGAEQVLLARGVLKPDPVSTAFIQRIDSQGPNRSSVSAFTLDVAQYCKYGGSRCTALSIEARNFERQQNAEAQAANTARLWNVYSSPGESDEKWRARSDCMRKKTESIQRHTYGQQDWYYSGSCY